MVDNRAAILKGAKAAHTLHHQLGVKENLEHPDCMFPNVRDTRTTQLMQ
jgi:hypothetical protein